MSHTTVDILGQDFRINDEPTHCGRCVERMRIEGLLFNCRMVQATYDDRNPQTRPRWDGPQGPFDADRNTRRFIAAMAALSDMLFLHGNGVHDPDRIPAMVRHCRESLRFNGPVVFNEDDHDGFDQPDNNLLAATGEHASWGFFDYRRPGESFEQGFQSVPVDWSINSARKRDFFAAVEPLTGGIGHP